MSESEGYLVSARKYRPATFRTVVGQKSLTATLKNAIETGRLAQAYLFCGPRGVGKTSCARIFAKTINCEHPTADGEACGECASCRAIEQGSSLDVVELDAASNNSVDNIRNLTEQVSVPPQSGKYRVFIIDEVHMLSNSAFNAFLKTLEEPPSYVVFILATTEKHKVIPTIMSRCQVYDFKRITVDDIAEHLAYVASQEGVEAEPAALNVIAQKADGAMRDALSIFDQVAASTGGHVAYDATIANLNVLDYDYYFGLIDCFMRGDVPQALLTFNDIRNKGFDPQFFINGLGSHIRNLMVAASPSTVSLLEVGKDIAAKYVEQAARVPVQWDYKAMGLINDCDLNYRMAMNKSFLVELTLIRLCQLLAPREPEAAAKPMAMPTPQTSAPQAAAPQTAAPKSATAQTAQPQAAVPSDRAASAPKVAMKPIARKGAGRAAAPTIHIGKSGANAPAATSAAASETKEAEPQPAEPPAAVPHADAPYDEAKVKEAWAAFTEKVLADGMHNLHTIMAESFPHFVEGDLYCVDVPLPKHFEDLEKVMPQLVPFMRSKLGNDAFSLKVQVVNDYVPSANRPLTDSEFMRETLEKNESLRDFLKACDPEYV